MHPKKEVTFRLNPKPMPNSMQQIAVSVSCHFRPRDSTVSFTLKMLFHAGSWVQFLILGLLGLGFQLPPFFLPASLEAAAPCQDMRRFALRPPERRQATPVSTRDPGARITSLSGLSDDGLQSSSHLPAPDSIGFLLGGVFRLRGGRW